MLIKEIFTAVAVEALLGTGQYAVRNRRIIRATLRASFTPGNQEMRVSVSALLNLPSDGKYLLMGTQRRPEFGPFGGALKLYAEGQQLLGPQNFRPDKPHNDKAQQSTGDFRGY